MSLRKPQPKTTTPLTWCFFLLLAIGFFQVYSSSSLFALEVYGDAWHFVKKQSLFIAVAGVCFWTAGRISIKHYLYLGAGLFFVSLVGMILTHIPGYGVKVGGATRWLSLFSSFKVEPGEFYKIGFGFFIYWLLFFKEKKQEMSFWWPFFLGLFVSLGLFLRQPDFGSVVLMSLSTLVVLFLIMKSFKPFLVVGSLAAASLCFFLFQETYRVERLLIFLNPWSDPQGKGFQTIQSFVAFKKGGFFGQGVGMSQSKLFFLPEAHTDFTLAVFAEEFGFVGVVVLLVLYAYLCFSALRLARFQEKDFKLMALGYYLASLFFLSFFINFCVNIGLVPTKGLPLPFLSYGGSSLLSTTFLFGFFKSLEKS